MPLDNLPGKLVTLTRDQRRDKFLRDYSLRNPGVPTGPGTQPYLDASVCADVTDVHVANAVTIANGISRATATGAALIDHAARLGTAPLPAVGAAGAVVFAGSSSGAKIFQGDVLTYTPTNRRFQCTATNTYLPGASVPIVGLDTGPGTNLPAGSVLQWQSPRVGSAATAVIALQADGSGTSGGTNAEGDDDLRRRLDYIASHPAASGNDAQYQQVVSTTPLVSVQQAFTYPAIKGPGSKGIAFTLRPATPGANRIPSATQIALMATYVGGQMPADDSVFPLQIIASPVTIVFKVLWSQGVSGWTDTTTWPSYIATPNLVQVAAPSTGATSPTYFRLYSSSITAPQVGQSIGFFDAPNLVFRRKKILTATVDGAGGYDITVDTSNGVSDTSYTPSIGQACCPWSDSLNTVVTSVASYFDTLGPGEMFSTFVDPGLRQRRSPISPQSWPSAITNRILGGSAAPIPASGAAQNLPPVPTLLTEPALQDVVLVEPAVPYATPVGVPGVSVNLLTLGNLVCFPE